MMQGVQLDLIRNSQVNDQLIDFQIEQGSTYELPLSVSGDFTTGIFEGDIRTDYLANTDNTLLAEFEFNNVAYDSQTGLTTFVASIPASVTKTIPPTFNAGKGMRGEINDGYYVYSIKYVDGLTVKRRFFGLVEVDPQVTDLTT